MYFFVPGLVKETEEIVLENIFDLNHQYIWYANMYMDTMLILLFALHKKVCTVFSDKTTRSQISKIVFDAIIKQ